MTKNQINGSTAMDREMLSIDWSAPGNPELMDRQFRLESMKYFRTQFTGDPIYMADRQQRIDEGAPRLTRGA